MQTHASHTFWRYVTTQRRGCWEWRGPRDEDGYGRFRGRRAHRVAYELTHKTPIPPRMVVRHTCDNPPCVRPNHLRLGTHAQNLVEGLDRDRFHSLRLRDIASIAKRAATKYGETPEARRRARANYRATKRRRCKRQLELVQSVRAAWAEERARRIIGVVRLVGPDGMVTEVGLGERDLMYEDLSGISESAVIRAINGIGATLRC